MIVIAKNSEKQLLEELGNLKLGNSEKILMHMKFSQTSVTRDMLFERFFTLLQDVPNSYMAQAYVCLDKDIFILLEGFMQSSFIDFFTKLADQLAIKNEDNILSVLKMSDNWVDLENLCVEKIKFVDYLENEEKAHKEEARVIALEAISEIDPNLIVNVSDTRKNNNEIVIMVVDDDQISRTLISNALDKSYRYTFARNGRNAFTGYIENAPDVLFLDIGMPDISGYDVLESIFQIDPHAHVVMFSGRKDKQNMMRAFELGAKGFLGKPFTREELEEHIKKSPFVQDKKNKEKEKECATG